MYCYEVSEKVVQIEAFRGGREEGEGSETEDKM